MKYLKVYIPINNKRNDFISRVLNLFFSGACNKLISKSSIWYLEFTEEGNINREIGLTDELIPQIALPNNTCYGFLSDSQMTYNDFSLEDHQLEALDQKVFEANWLKLEEKSDNGSNW